MENKYQESIKYFEETNWKKPESLVLQLYEISVVNSYRSFTYFTIKEIFVPQYNLSFNNHTNKEGYNIILNASNRFKNDFKIEKSYKQPNLINTITITNEDPNLDILFDIFTSYIKSQQKINKITELFN